MVGSLLDNEADCVSLFFLYFNARAYAYAGAGMDTAL